MDSIFSEKYTETGLLILSILLVIFLGIIVYFFLHCSLKILLTENAVNATFYQTAKNILEWLVWITVFINILEQIGINPTSIFAVILNLADTVTIGFIAVWSILSNLSCTLFLIFFKIFRIGDEIEIVDLAGSPGLKGRVTDFNIMFTSFIESESESADSLITQITNNIFFQKTLRREKGIKTISLGQHLLSRPVRQLAE